MQEGLFAEYESLVKASEAAFEKVSSQFREKVRCRRGCADCCQAAFGLFLVEAVYIRRMFSGLDRGLRRLVLSRCERAEKALERVFRGSKDSGIGRGAGIDLSSVRVRCPLLSGEQTCSLYEARPITCRVYGIPTTVGDRAVVCPLSGFEKGVAYPTFELGAVHRRLYNLSLRLLGSDPAGPQKAGLLISMSKALSTPLEDLLAGRY
jgi:Fe-S-cluster containining protein